jgi:hypothetical protein
VYDLLAGEFVMVSRLIILFSITTEKCCSKLWVCKHLPYTFSLKDISRQDVLRPLLFNFSLEYTLKRGQTNQKDLKLNGMHYLPVYPYDVSILGGSIHVIKHNRELW